MLTDSDASACEANACGLRQSVTPTLCKRSTRLQAEEHANRTEARDSDHRTGATQSGGVVLVRRCSAGHRPKTRKHFLGVMRAGYLH